MKQHSAESPRSKGRGQVFGVLLIAGGIAWLFAVTGIASVSMQVTVSALLILLGLGMIMTRSSRGFVLLGALMVVFLAVGSRDVDIKVAGFEGAGERNVSPDHITALAPDYNMGAGRFTLDLGSIEFPDGVTEVEARLVVGEMIVIVPAGVRIEGDASVVGGEVILFGKALGSGFPVGVDLIHPGSSASTLRLDLNVGIGSIEIRRGS